MIENFISARSSWISLICSTFQSLRVRVCERVCARACTFRELHRNIVYTTQLCWRWQV